MFSQGYIIDSQICILTLYIFYRTVLEGCIPHRIARSYLVTMIPISLLLPLISLPLLEAPTITVMASQGIQYVTSYEFSEPIAKSINYIVVGYMAGVSLMALWILIGAVKLMLIMRKSRPERIEGLRVIFANQRIAAYSVFNYIFIDTTLRNSAILNTLLAHEECHIRLRHSMDLLYMSTMRALLWFNPAVWHIGSKLRQVHEYQVDEEVIDQGYSKARYVNLLIMTETGITPELASPFSYKLTKKRLTMLSNRKQSKSHKRLLLVLPIFAALLAAFSLTTRAAVEIISPTINSAVITDTTKKYSFEIEIVMNDDNNAEANISKLESNDNRVFSSKIIKLVGTPDSSKHNQELKLIDVDHSVNNDIDRNPLIIVDGVSTKNINEVNPSSIESVSLIKDKKATSIYGEKGKNGVILIATDKNTTHNNASVNLENVTVVRFKTQDSVSVTVVPYGTQKTAKESTPVTHADVMPKFNGGNVDNFRQWVQQNIKYPESASSNKTEGRIIIQLIVDEVGNVSDTKIIRGLDDELNKEVIRVVKESPKWTPGSNKGQPVKVSYIMPIEFKLSK